MQPGDSLSFGQTRPEPAASGISVSCRHAEKEPPSPALNWGRIIPPRAITVLIARRSARPEENQRPMLVAVACRFRPEFPEQCGTARRFRSVLLRKMSVLLRKIEWL